MGAYAWTAIIWAVGGIIASYLMTPQNACFAPVNQGISFFGVMWISILGGLLILDMTTWETKHGDNRARGKGTGLER